MVEHAYLKVIFLTQEGDSLSTQLSVRMHPKRRHGLTQVRARIAYSAYKEVWSANMMSYNNFSAPKEINQPLSPFL